ncbi:MAG: hypothetical protein COS34_11960 [Lysobacterales bacterium CG02_land_8_20_14_3_00_62_12]|nr:MAG: hypothetical protein COS34_11960 [Xanthomonadales bacterium CG02_land_8_20_14_3_00_62_12]PJA39069.1 MAG: hypothetical protein CO182_09770 [Xanthomonadales bacterium CG_4_9_14_3_um_filter_62_6]
MLQPIKLESLRELVAAGSIQSATIQGQKGGYAIVASIGMQQRPLGTKFGDVRVFGNTDTAVKLLRDLGLFQFNLDVSNYEAVRLRAARPDVTEKAKTAAALLAHDRWFREQVIEAIAKDESGAATWHDHDAMWDELEAQAVALVAANAKKSEAAAAEPTLRSVPGKRRG